HVNHYGCADDIGLRHKTPIAAVPGVFAIIAEHEIAAHRNGDRAEVIGRIGRIMAVRFAESLAVGKDAALANLYGISGHSDQPLDEILIAVGKWRVEDHHLLAARLAPESQVITREGQADIIAEAAHEQMIANEQSALHRGGGNHAGLHHDAGKQEHSEAHPNPAEPL